jgi:hypothetical protein
MRVSHLAILPLTLTLACAATPADTSTADDAAVVQTDADAAAAPPETDAAASGTPDATPEVERDATPAAEGDAAADASQPDAGSGLPYDVPLRCADVLRDPATGRCAPSTAACPPGQLVSLLTGCMTNGVLQSACPPEFLEADGVCVPRPEACPRGWHLASVEGCFPDEIGCGQAPFGNIALDPARDLYVDANAPEGGDGSLERPFQSLQAAWPAFREVQDARLVLAAGRYPFSPRLRWRQSLVGVCPGRVVLADDATPIGENGELWGRYVIAVNHAEDVFISGVTLEGAAGIGILDSPQVNIENVVVRDGPPPALYVGRDSNVGVTKLFATNIEATPAHPQGDAPSFGAVVAEDTGATLRIERSAILDVHTGGLVARNHGTILANFVAVSTAPSADVAHAALAAQRGGELEALSVVATGHHALDAVDEGSHASANISLLVGSLRTVHVERSASASTRDSLLRGGSEMGVYVSDRATYRSNGDRIEASPASSQAIGVFVSNEGEAEVLAANVVGPWRVGLMARDDNDSLSYLRVDRVLVEGTAGQGVVAAEGSDTDVFASAIVGTTFAGVHATGARTRLRLRESLVSGTRPEASQGLMGVGALATMHAELQVVESVLRDNSVAGALVSDLASLRAEGLHVAGTRGGLALDDTSAPVPVAGDGIEVLREATALLLDVSLADTGRVGVLVDEGTANIEACSATETPIAVASQRGGVVTLSDAAAQGCPLNPPAETLAVPSEASLAPP